MAAAASKGMLGKLMGGSLVFGSGAFLLNASLYNVEPGHRAIIFDRLKGVHQTTVNEGTHFLIPGIQKAVIYDVRTRPRTITTITGTRDLQVVNISLRVLSRPSVEQLPQIYQRLGIDFDERVLPSIGNEVLKAVVAQYNADQLLTMRDKVSKAISDNLQARADEFNLLLDDVSITHLAFSREFTKAIESKQVAQQEAERSKFIVMKSEQEKRAAVIQAEGESEAACLISNALEEAGNGLVLIRRIEAAKDIAETLSRSRSITYLPSGNNMLLNLPSQ